MITVSNVDQSSAVITLSDLTPGSSYSITLQGPAISDDASFDTLSIPPTPTQPFIQYLDPVYTNYVRHDQGNLVTFAASDFNELQFRFLSIEGGTIGNYTSDWATMPFSDIGGGLYTFLAPIWSGYTIRTKYGDAVSPEQPNGPFAVVPLSPNDPPVGLTITDVFEQVTGALTTLFLVFAQDLTPPPPQWLRTRVSWQLDDGEWQTVAIDRSAGFVEFSSVLVPPTSKYEVTLPAFTGATVVRIKAVYSSVWFGPDAETDVYEYTVGSNPIDG